MLVDIHVGQIKKRLKPLVTNFTVYVLSYGISLSQDYSYRKISEKFEEVIKENIGKATIIGISYGGFVALAFAADFPELTEKLILIVSAYKPSETTGKKFVDDMIEQAKLGHHYQIAKIKLSLWNVKWMRFLLHIPTWLNRKKFPSKWNPLTTIQIAYSDIMSTIEERKTLLKNIIAPTFILGGTKDLVFSEKNYNETAKLIANAKYICFKGAGHMLPIERKQDFIEKLTEVLNV